MNIFHLLRPVVILLVAVGLVTFSSRASAEERDYHLHGIAVLNFATGEVVGAGNATHLGNYTETGLVTFLGGGLLTGSATFTDRHGNQLSETFTGQANADGTISGLVTFTGGTGRFEGATGSASLTAQFLPDGSLAVVVDGTIDY